MGMYTGLRLKCNVKEEYRDLIDKIMNENCDWIDFIDDYPFLVKFAELHRASFIPFGSLSYMPDEWETVKYNNDGRYSHIMYNDGFERQFNKETGYWAFACSLKNYNDEINIFLETVLPIIAESVEHCEVFYEEWEESNMYSLADGEMIQLKEGIKYDKYDN